MSTSAKLRERTETCLQLMTLEEVKYDQAERAIDLLKEANTELSQKLQQRDQAAGRRVPERGGHASEEETDRRLQLPQQALIDALAGSQRWQSLAHERSQLLAACEARMGELDREVKHGVETAEHLKTIADNHREQWASERARARDLEHALTETQSVVSTLQAEALVSHSRLVDLDRQQAMVSELTHSSAALNEEKGHLTAAVSILKQENASLLRSLNDTRDETWRHANLQTNSLLSQLNDARNKATASDERSVRGAIEAAWSVGLMELARLEATELRAASTLAMSHVLDVLERQEQRRGAQKGSSPSSFPASASSYPSQRQYRQATQQPPQQQMRRMHLRHQSGSGAVGSAPRRGYNEDNDDEEHLLGRGSSAAPPYPQRSPSASSAISALTAGGEEEKAEQAATQQPRQRLPPSSSIVAAAAVGQRGAAVSPGSVSRGSLPSYASLRNTPTKS